MNTRHLSSWAVLLLCIISLYSSCKKDNPQSLEQESKTSEVNCQSLPDFNRDSALAFVQKQVDFGPRTPGSEAHDLCADWMKNKLASYGLQTITQTFQATVYTGEEFTGKNIIGMYNPDAQERILLCAHWDSRPIADYDPDEDKKEQAVPGANDGASGVGVLIELARILEEADLPIGVDIVFFDLEDYGKSKGGRESVNTWALGSQYWSRNRHNGGHKQKFGILLDMVGAENAKFRKERISMQYAEKYVNDIWNLAKLLGYSNYFIDETSDPITDDHFFINRLAGIPTLDIIHQDVESDTQFFPHWHTTNDDMEHISARTLDAVGTVVLNVLCREGQSL